MHGKREKERQREGNTSERERERGGGGGSKSISIESQGHAGERKRQREGKGEMRESGGGGGDDGLPLHMLLSQRKSLQTGNRGLPLGTESACQGLNPYPSRSGRMRDSCEHSRSECLGQSQRA